MVSSPTNLDNLSFIIRMIGLLDFHPLVHKRHIPLLTTCRACPGMLQAGGQALCHYSAFAGMTGSGRVCE